jgi:hypothetical protein
MPGFPIKASVYFKFPMVRCQGIGIKGLSPSSILKVSNPLQKTGNQK